uniref:Uncharacterized protein n=1 Tax=viral metagenome TaxID=1070528 RepID=A0A6M3L8A1_9ZZZZ
MTEPRVKTAEEVREEFLNHVRETTKYWAALPDKTPLERLEGLTFSLMVIFDGGSMALPAFDIVCSPHPDDEAYCREEGINWYPDGAVINECQLHEML